MDNIMILGIIKNKKKIYGKCLIKNTTISGNKTKTIICNNIPALSNDLIIFTCKKCKNERTVTKKVFFTNRIKNHLCTKCLKEKNYFNKYGYKSWNQNPLIQKKQHTSESIRKQWQNQNYRKMQIQSMHNRWKDESYKSKMGKLFISKKNKFQTSVFEQMLQKDKNWIMEYPIPDTNFFVDLYNVKTRQIIECFGDYWHCNPKKYNKNYYHNRIHKTAKEIWKHDKDRIKTLTKLGFNVKIIWESAWNASNKRSN